MERTQACITWLQLVLEERGGEAEHNILWSSTNDLSNNLSRSSWAHSKIVFFGIYTVYIIQNFGKNPQRSYYFEHQVNVGLIPITFCGVFLFCFRGWIFQFGFALRTNRCTLVVHPCQNLPRRYHYQLAFSGTPLAKQPLEASHTNQRTLVHSYQKDPRRRHTPIGWVTLVLHLVLCARNKSLFLSFIWVFGTKEKTNSILEVPRSDLNSLGGKMVMVRNELSCCSSNYMRNNWYLQ